ncbi:MAG: hypothetical protein GF383_09510 [Candidatus Lokiarchaeota archaeon]|nr:hypothetical protein [Candidatus Lokiarchaeota archaeon]MBD3340750.1 hypothetical protein [Candidatus Lokiarchaeota archaeon]
MLRVGIIGCGIISNLNILGYLYSQDTEVVAVSDVDVKCAGNKLERWGLRTTKIYTDYKKMIDKEDLDIVEILTPHHLHCPMTIYCAQAGVPGISVQKPMAHTISDCNQMIQVCKDEGSTLKLFENFRFYPPYLRAKELLDQGTIGERLNFRIISIGTGGPSMPLNVNAYIWRTNVDKCGGGPWVYDDGQHKFSTALWLMGYERVENLYGWIDYFTSVLDSPANMIWKYPSKNPDDPPVYGTMEFALAPNMYYPSNYYGCDEFIEISGSKGMMWLNQCTSGGNFLSKTPQYPPIVVFTEGEVKTYGEDLPRDWRYSFINSTEHFIEVMKTSKKDPIYTGEQGKNLCIFAKMPYISNQESRLVEWDEISAEGERDRSCVVEGPLETQCDEKGLTKYNRRQKKDLRKAKDLNHIRFKYQYELESEKG